MSIEEKRRELFDEWLSAQACHGVFMGGYTEEEEAGAWAAFNAALDAVVIELPPSMGMPDEDDCDEYEEFEALEAITCTANGMRHSCIKAIESTGLGLKVLP